MLGHRWKLRLVSLLLVAAIGCRAPAPAPAPAAPTLPTSATAGGASIVAIAPPAQQCCPKQTLPQWLGLTGLVHGVGKLFDRLRNRLGSIWPGLEAKPEVLSISDPANLESDNPAVSAAAGVKAQEDEAAQKAKAIAYLASVGCAGCYPGIEDAILAALDDCTEAVRFGAAKALRDTATMPCKNCCRTACCGPKVREKLMKLAFDMDEQGCYVELSDRVRRMARLALANCNCVPEKPGPKKSLPEEGPTSEEAPAASPPAPAAASVLRSPNGATSLAASKSVVGSGLVDARRGSSQTAEEMNSLQAYSSRGPASAESSEVAWEAWSAPSGSFASREEALAMLTMTRTQIMSSQPNQYISPALSRAAHDWTDPGRISSPAVAKAVATIPIGGVSGPIEDRFGWHLVRVLARRPAVPRLAVNPEAQQASYVTADAAGAIASQMRPIVVALPAANCNCK